MVGFPEMQSVFKTEGHGGDGYFGLEIKLYIPRELTDNDHRAIREAARKLESALDHETKLVDPKYIKQKQDWLTAARQCFMVAGIGPIYTEETENLYWGEGNAPEDPWLIVTTEFGVITFGWRKRVISIDWSKSKLKATADELFPDEDVTKQGCLIHAWGYDKAAEYLKVLHTAWKEQTK
jgi:hypothetical protein